LNHNFSSTKNIQKINKKTTSLLLYCYIFKKNRMGKTPIGHVGLHFHNRLCLFFKKKKYPFFLFLFLFLFLLDYRQKNKKYLDRFIKVISKDCPIVQLFWKRVRPFIIILLIALLISMYRQEDGKFIFIVLF